MPPQAAATLHEAPVAGPSATCSTKNVALRPKAATVPPAPQDNGSPAQKHRRGQAWLTAATHPCANLCGDLTKGHEPQHTPGLPA